MISAFIEVLWGTYTTYKQQMRITIIRYAAALIVLTKQVRLFYCAHTMKVHNKTIVKFFEGKFVISASAVLSNRRKQWG